MKVAYDHQIFAEQAYGGISRYFFEIARGIQECDGYEVAILAPFFVNNYIHGDASLKVWGRHLKRLPRPGRLVQRLNGELVRWKLRRESPDIVHETYYLGRKLAPRKSKTVITVYDMIHEKFPHFFPPGDKTRERKKAAVARADHVICISENTRADLIELLGVDRAKTSVTHLAHSSSKHLTVSSARQAGRPYIAYVGVRGGYKNFSGLVQAFAASKLLKENFSITCFGGGEITSAEREAMIRAGLASDQVVHTRGSDELLESVYRGAAAFVYPSLYEGFGLPPLEAMAADCPVACSRTSSMPEVCGDAAEYFDPADPQSIASAIERVVSSTGRRIELIGLGQGQIKKFSWNDCARKTAEVYEAVSQR